MKIVKKRGIKHETPVLAIQDVSHRAKDSLISNIKNTYYL